MIGFREASAADRDAILALRRTTFPDEDREKQQPDFWDWEFARGYAGPGRAFVAEADGRIAAHIAFVPQTFVSRSTTIRGALAVDAMTHPDYRRQKLFSGVATFAVNSVRRDFQVITVFPIRKQVMGGLEAAGWKTVEDVPVLLRPVSFRRAIADLCSVARPRATTAAEAAAATPPLESFDRMLETDAIRQPRSIEFLEWRYLRNPHWHYTIDGDEQAFVVYRDTVLKGMRTMAIADCGGDPRALRALLRRGWADAYERGVGLAAAFMSREHPAYGELRRAGFFPGPHRFRLMLQRLDRSLPASSWSLSWGDTDNL